MTSFLAALIALSISSTVTTPAYAQSVNDVQCVVASNVVATASKDQKQNQVARDMLHFYLGRIDGRFNEAQLKAEIVVQRKTITAANINVTMQSCLAVAQRKVKAIQSMTR